MTKTTFQEEDPKIAHILRFKEFTYSNFQSELISKLNSRNLVKHSTFEISFVEFTDKYAPKGRKIVCGNQKPHVNKTPRSAIMKRFQLKNRL